jgi:hypothetical protein
MGQDFSCPEVQNSVLLTPIFGIKNIFLVFIMCPAQVVEIIEVFHRFLLFIFKFVTNKRRNEAHEENTKNP